MIKLFQIYRALSLLLAALLALTGCKTKTEQEYIGAREAEGLPWWEVSQAWTAEQKKAFWFTPQGSRLIPYDWFLHLEEEGTSKLFRRDELMERFNYIASPTDSHWNPDALPIGFAKSLPDTEGVEWMGFTCAACHTAQINLGGVPTVIDGAQALGDFQGFLKGLDDAMISTHESPEKFARFADSVLGQDRTAEETQALKNRFVPQMMKLADLIHLNHSPIQYGYGRVDAFGAILNRVSSENLAVPSNRAPADAPVSYPFLWGTSQSSVVQWNGSVSNAGIGPLVRNIGEVVGVNGDVDVIEKCSGEDDAKNCFVESTHDIADNNKKGIFPGFPSSMNMKNLGLLEVWMKDLRSPKWPENLLGTIDQEKASAGEILYKDKGCSGCHQLVSRGDEGEIYEPRMIKQSTVDTDPKMAANFIMETNPITGKPWESGKLEGYKESFIAGKRYGETMPSRGSALGTVVIGAAVEDPLAAVIAGVRAYSGAQKGKKFDPMSYKARPLTGIWATAPYLHNGSVPNLYEVLLPESERSTRFYLGSRNLDTRHVGYLNDKGAAHAFEFDTTLEGNRNTGHNFGAGLSESERFALVEYLKTL